MRGQLQNPITCPTCRQPTPVPANGVAGLQSSFHTQSMLEVIASGEQETAAVRSGEGCSLVHDPKVYCSSHKDREAELYCETCGQFICYKCVAKGSYHHSHEYKEIEKACEQYMAEMNSGMTVLANLHQEVSTQQVDIQAKINKIAEQRHASIEQSKTVMFGEVNKVVKQKLTAIATRHQTTMATRDQYQNPLDIVSKGVCNSYCMLLRIVWQ